MGIPLKSIGESQGNACLQYLSAYRCTRRGRRFNGSVPASNCSARHDWLPAFLNHGALQHPVPSVDALAQTSVNASISASARSDLLASASRAPIEYGHFTGEVVSR